jgi:CubicO group peptidase (beta-lactamase class C family)
MRNTPVVLFTAGLAALLTACSSSGPGQPLAVASAFTSQHLCSETFVSGQDPDQVYAERVKPLGAMSLVDPVLHYEVDRQKKEVRTSVAGLYATRAVYRGRLGCLLVQDPADVTPVAPLPPALRAAAADQPAIAGPALVEPRDPALRAALEQAFVDRDQPCLTRSKAVVVLKDGQLIAERYAKGWGVDTQGLGMSASKSLTNALIGILVREGKLAVKQPAPFAAWQGAGDPRRVITIDELLRQTSGLSLQQDNSGWDANARMLFIERDEAAFAERAGLTAAPGTHWAYSDGHYTLLSRIIRDAVGGQEQDVSAFAQRELFGPLGMKDVTLSFDGTGTPLGANHLFASARDWARLGQLYLDDGMAGGRRVLPEGWVRYSSSQTLNTGYGAGFWTNLRHDINPDWGNPWGMEHVPKDAFYAMGFMGQYVVIVPSLQLVVVRLGISHYQGSDIAAMDRLMAAIIAAVQAPGTVSAAATPAVETLTK